MTRIRIAAIQEQPGVVWQENLALAGAHLRALAHRGVQIAVFPEYFLSFRGAAQPAAALDAQDLTGPFVTGLAALAQETRIAVICGVTERLPREQGRCANTIVVIDQHGTLQLSYQKVHLYDSFGSAESAWIRPGDPEQLPVCELFGMTVGVQTCFDIRFPESSRRLVDAGVQLIAVPAQWVPGPRKHLAWHSLLAARAIENVCALVGANQPEPSGIGFSLILNEWGERISSCAAEPGVCIAEIDSGHIDRSREQNTALQQRVYSVALGR